MSIINDDNPNRDTIVIEDLNTRIRSQEGNEVVGKHAEEIGNDK